MVALKRSLAALAALVPIKAETPCADFGISVTQTAPASSEVSVWLLPTPRICSACSLPPPTFNKGLLTAMLETFLITSRS